MEIKLPYSDIASIIESKYDKKIAIEYIDESSASIAIKTKIGFISLSPSIIISDVEASGSTISLKYDGSFGVDMIVGGVLAYLTNNAEGFDKLAEVHDKKIVVHLEAVSRLQEALTYIELKSISFTPEALRVKLAAKAI